jgi:DUF4097 and DUF4098 domain-containing protein YvlB
MKLYKIIFMLIFIPAIVFTQEQIKKEIKTKPGDKLDIELTTGGDIDVSGWDKDVVAIVANVQGNKEDYVVDVSERSSEIKVEISYEGRRNRNSGSISVDIQVPFKYDLELETMGGDVTLKDIEGRISGETMGGDIELYNLKGDVEQTTMGGDIKVEDCDLDGQVKTMGGDISLRDVIGGLNASTMGGDVTYRSVKKTDEHDDAREVKISTMGGDIEVDDAPGGANVSTMGGDIHTRSVVKYVKAKTMGGDIKIDKIDGGVEASTMGGDINVRMVGDPNKYNRDVDLSSMGGDIILTVPAGLSMDFDIKLTLADRASGDYKISSDFPIEIEKKGDWENPNWSDRRFIYGTGKVAGGKNKIRIETVNGNITIKKRNE